MAIKISLPETYTEFIPSELEVQQLDEKPNGVYVLFDSNDRCLYVGQSGSLPTRLRTHLNGKGTAEDFYEDIAKIRIYFIDDPYEREIYETYAITYFKGEYNRAKSYTRIGILRSTREYIDDLKLELDILKTRRSDLFEEYKSYQHATKEPNYNKWNNFTGDYSNAYLDSVLEDRSDPEYEIDEVDEEAFLYVRQLRTELREVDEELASVKAKIRETTAKLRIT
jgi:hypothetical protein